MSKSQRCCAVYPRKQVILSWHLAFTDTDMRVITLQNALI